MILSGHRWATLLLALSVTVATGCGDDDDRVTGVAPPPTSTSSGGGGDGGGSGGSGSGGNGTGGDDLPPCQDAATPAVEVYPPGSDLQLRYLARLGNRWMASGYLGYVSFDGDGSNADPTPSQLAGSFNAVASEGAVVGLASGGDNAVAYQRFDEGGPAIGQRVLANQTPNGVVSALAGSNSVTIWGWNGMLSARTVSADGSILADAFEVALGAYAGSLQLSAVSTGDAVTLAWYGAEFFGLNQSWFVTMSDSMTLTEPVMFHETQNPHELRQIVVTDNGYMVLISGEAPAVRPELLTLDAEGLLVGSVNGLDEAVLGYALASRGSAIAVVAGRSTGQPQIRVFDLNLTPVGPWVCLGPNHNDAVPAAMAIDGSGYAIIYQTDDGAVMLSRVDGLGTGPP